MARVIKSTIGEVLYMYDGPHEDPTDEQLVYAALEQARINRFLLDGADFSGMTLNNMRIRYASLKQAKFEGTELFDTSFYEVNLEGAKFDESYLINAAFRKTNLEFSTFTLCKCKSIRLINTNLTNAHFQHCDLSHAGFYNTNAHQADFVDLSLRSARFDDSYFTEVRFEKVDFNNLTLQGIVPFDRTKFQDCKNFPKKYLPYYSNCPEEGGFIAWKQGRNKEIIKLYIPEEAKRVSPINNRKCRASHAKVLEIFSPSDDALLLYCASYYDHNMIYEVGEYVFPDSYDPSPFVFCSYGIHFFMTKQEAIDF